jgi:hypothetical protein
VLEALWYVLIAVSCLITVGNWRHGLYLGVAADCLRDPVRKLIADEPILVTLSVPAVWLVILIAAISSEWPEVKLMAVRYPRIKTALAGFLVALVPAAAISALLYAGGWKLVVVGVGSYVLPAAGIAVGYLWAQSEREIYRVFMVYSIVNGIVLIGTPIEFLQFDIAGLGGLKDAEWIRYHDGYIVNLIAGFYRSPDIMGLHAAHVVMFSLMLAVRSKTSSRFGWIGVALWAAFCMLLCGRRKMVGIPLVFIASYLGIGMLRGVRHINALAGGVIVAVLLGLAAGVSLFDRDQYTEYTNYAGTIFTQGPGRANELIVGSTLSTLQQVGILGAGLGTATQGRYYVGVQAGGSRRGWQEDGVSRLLMEFGIPGVLLIVIAGGSLFAALRQGFVLVDPESSVQVLQMGAASVLTANLASFTISHQQFSGDPVCALFATLLAGVVLGAPRIFARQGALGSVPIAAAHVRNGATRHSRPIATPAFSAPNRLE